jgi:hypothetical protein
MKTQNNSHLLDEQILWAVIDEEELVMDAQLHLRECPVCQKKVGQFRGELQEFGQKAGQAVPPFSRAVRLPIEKPAAFSHNVGWLPVFGAAAMAAFVLFFYFMGVETMDLTKLTSVQNQQILLEDVSLMHEISELVEVPLPEGLYAIAGDNGTLFADDLYEIGEEVGTGLDGDLYQINGDSGIGYDEDFLDFVVPDLQDDFQSEFVI